MILKSDILEFALSPHQDLLEGVSQRLMELESSNAVVLRWGVIRMDTQTAFVEVGTLSEASGKSLLTNSSPFSDTNDGIHVALIIPTGVGASVGGYIGDAGPIAQALEAIADTVIIHPNVVNAADFYSGGPRSFYTDGLTLDRFFSGQIQLKRPTRKRLGLLLDRLDTSAEAVLLNAANGIRATKGADIVAYSVCTERVRAHVSRSGLGHFVGRVENPEVLFEGAAKLISLGANAIAVVTESSGIDKSDWIAHYSGQATNPVGAIEALISRSITWRTGVTCAHAPVFTGEMGQADKVVDPRAAAEVASGSGLPCLLYGLLQSPTLANEGGIRVQDLSAIIVPFDCAAGPPALAAKRLDIPLVAVKSNRCVVGVPLDPSNIPTMTVVNNYPEAIAFVACEKASVSWETVRRPIGELGQI